MSHFIGDCNACHVTYGADRYALLPLVSGETAYVCEGCLDAGCPACSDELDDGTPLVVFGGTFMHADCLKAAMDEADSTKRSDAFDYEHGLVAFGLYGRASW